MVSKKNLLIYFIILLCCIRIIIVYSYTFYNKKHEINFSINEFKRESFTINGNEIVFYESLFKKNDSLDEKTIIILHDIFKSSYDSLEFIKSNNLTECDHNLKIILIDLPAHGNSFKNNGIDYSYRNISFYINSLIENLDINHPYVICNHLSSNIGLNMISMNDSLIYKLILINPEFYYNPKYVNISNKLYNKMSTLIYFIRLLLYNDDKDLDSYIKCYFNYKKSSNKYAYKILKDSSQISTSDISSNVPINILIDNKYEINPKYIRDLSSKFSSIVISPK